MDPIAKEISKKLSYFKGHFLGAPMYKAFKMLVESININILLFSGNKVDESVECEIGYRPKEKYWIISQGDHLQIFYGIHFDDKTDQGLARIILLVLIYTYQG